MKIKIDIDCSPQEARAFLGLPEVAPLQDVMMKELETRLRDGLKSMDPETLFKAWLPSASGLAGGLKGWEEFQRQFWAQMSGAAGGGKAKD
ncbi:MAG: DUF6489 family protein [Kiloniellales bacterium]|jgi:hypothetical protein|nr:DUF6489 family protein [Kiloniellales bacterium]